ncbi:MAG: lipid II flippase MurJ, partial [Fusobacteriaceae bacterium]
MFKSGIGMMIIIMASRVLGLFRSVAVAYYFGAGEFTDAYYSAFKISNFFRQLLGEGALGNSFIPLYNDKVIETGEEESKKFIYSILNLIFLFSLVITIITVVFSKEIIDFTVMGFSEETKELASRLLKIMSAYFIFISLSGMISAVLNNFKQFLIPASTGIFFNFAIIISTIMAGKTHGVMVLGYGVVFAGLLQFLVVLPSFFKIVKGYSFKIDFRDEYLKKIAIMI